MKSSLSNNTKTLDDILYQGLRPWLEQNSLDEKFASKLSSVKEYSTNSPFRYQIDFHRPFDHKTKYYSKLIINATKSEINRLIDLINEDKNDKLIKYWLDDTLNKRLKTRLKDLGKLIREKDFSLSYIDPKKTSFDIDRKHKANTYIIQLLKLSYIQLYLEIQDAFSTWIDDKLLLEDFYTQLLHEPVPDKYFISKVQAIELEVKQKLKPNAVINQTNNSFHSFTYIHLAKHPDKLIDLYDSLKKNNFIKKDTTAANFKRVFSGAEIKNPIIWTGNVSEFYYFIKLLYTKNKLIKDLKQNQWKVACKCFLQSDGTKFNYDGLRKNQAPKSSGHLLESSISLLM